MIFIFIFVISHPKKRHAFLKLIYRENGVTNAVVILLNNYLLKNATN